jgi:uncharacterized protein YegP (UPF0339 family)
MGFTIYQSERDGLWYWHIKSANGRIIADGGEGYENKTDAQTGAALAKKELVEAFPDVSVSEEVDLL